MTTIETVLENTTKQDQELARASILQLRSAASITLHPGFTKIKIEEQEKFLQIPEKAFQLLVEIVSSMAEGKSITLILSETAITTQQAADMLNVSRPHIIKLLENEIIPYKKVGTHRRIELKHLLEYIKNLKENRKQKLNFLAEQAQELNLGY